MKELYEKVWTNPSYRINSPGARYVMTFEDIMTKEFNMNLKSTIVDYGCGTGRACQYLCRRGYKSVSGIDIASNCLDFDAKTFDNFNFYPESILNLKEDKQIPISEYGYCTDVMEHLNPKDIRLAFAGIRAKVSKYVFFNISTIPDKASEDRYGTDLHTSVFAGSWWRKQCLKEFSEIYNINTLKDSVLFIAIV